MEGSTTPDDNPFLIKTLVIDDCGMTDKIFEQILIGINAQSFIKNIHYVNHNVLGPRSAKSLRAQNVKDLIFNGGKKDKAARSCTATLVFDKLVLSVCTFLFRCLPSLACSLLRVLFDGDGANASP